MMVVLLLPGGWFREFPPKGLHKVHIQQRSVLVSGEEEIPSTSRLHFQSMCAYVAS